MSIMVGVGKGAGAGVLIKNAEALERFEKVDTLVVDKTGTLTEGRPRLTAIVAADGFDETLLISPAASLERSSERPLAAAILAAAKDRNAPVRDVADFRSVTGKGITGFMDSKRVAVGTAQLPKDLGVDTCALDTRAEELRKDGATAMFVTVDGGAAGILAIADPIKQTTQDALAKLRDENICIVMPTGDNRTAAEAVAQKLGITVIEAGVLPDGKNAIVRKLRGEGRIVAMAGDGVNNAPARAEADIGIAMGTGTDVAIESAGMTLVQGRSGGDCSGARVKPDHHARYQTKPGTRLRLQRPRDSNRSGCALPGLRSSAQSGDRGGGHESRFDIGHRQCAAGPLVTRIVHLTGRSLIVEVPHRMIHAMFDRLILRQIAALVVALGIFLSGAAPAWAGATMAGDGSLSSGMAMMMPGMDMANNCMAGMDKGSPAKQAPCKNTDNSCAACAGCAVNISLVPQFSAASLLYQRDTGLFAAAAEPDGLAIAPDLPPPILRA